ncbi:hypothetical protein DWX58_03595 [Pseudoflavonifractor sp. AF19-9AC]|uniref:hypothetical protein n=1 Tax=Pseudoflavonifractor sp. AF19-9AC TaxID=2292244 RepID=UPI000E50B928|nr:hypothetical protein [Pseudoflavonifractor sp. AF19-9AC]RHR10493.1 hypothetical protein DWX58_03595 [Pseudoflavonifractor sp. AF19-9AC]
MKNERGKLVLGALGLLAGLLLIGCALVLGDRLPGSIIGLMCGCGGALGGVGGTALLIPLLMRSMSPEERREAERAEYDERVVLIREKAAQSSFYWTLCLLWVPFVVALMQGSLLWMILSTGAVVLHNVFYLVNLARWDRRL